MRSANASCTRAKPRDSRLYSSCARRWQQPERTRPAQANVKNSADLIRKTTAVHLDQLADKLREARVRRVIEPLLSGDEERGGASKDLDRLRDLGLIARDDPPRIANPIYPEFVPRELTSPAQGDLPQLIAR